MEVIPEIVLEVKLFYSGYKISAQKTLFGRQFHNQLSLSICVKLARESVLKDLTVMIAGLCVFDFLPPPLAGILQPA